MMPLLLVKNVSGGAPPTYAILNPSDKSAGVTLSGGNLVATSNGGGPSVFCGVRSDIGKSSGKWFWEITVTTIDIGTMIGSIAVTDAIDCDGTLAELDGKRVYFSGTGNAYTPLTAYGASYTTGDVLGFALDMDGGTLICYKNGSSQGTLVTGLSGTFHAAPFLFNDAGAVVTANFGASAFVHSVPGGYNSGLYT